jgi:hypothetical protein
MVRSIRFLASAQGQGGIPPPSLKLESGHVPSVNKTREDLCISSKVTYAMDDEVRHEDERTAFEGFPQKEYAEQPSGSVYF